MQVDLVLTNTLTRVRLGQLLLKPTWARLEYIIINVHFCAFAGPTFGSVHFPMAPPCQSQLPLPNHAGQELQSPQGQGGTEKTKC